MLFAYIVAYVVLTIFAWIYSPWVAEDLTLRALVMIVAPVLIIGASVQIWRLMRHKTADAQEVARNAWLAQQPVLVDIETAQDESWRLLRGEAKLED